MRKNLFLRLFLLIALSTLLYSCRNNELLTEQEAYNNSSQFRPTSKTIRLEQSKHQLVLKTELQKAQDNLQKIKTNASGKTVDYANGVSVDTDHVTYIEYGPVFHTYTFNLIRENAPENAPVENLVLASLPDGGYKELLVSYNFTPQEKLDLVSGKGVKTAGKTTAIELAQGTYSGGISNKGMGGTESCSYNTVDMYFSCYTGEHNEGNESSWGGCNWQSEGGYPAQHLTVVALVCTADTSLGDDGSGGGVSIGDTSGLGSGTNDGTPTLPTLTLPRDTPCGRAKVPVVNANNILNAPTISTEKAALENHAANSFTEYGMAIVGTGSSIIAQDPYTNNDPSNPGSINIIIPTLGDYLASAHTHPSHGAAPPSVKDLYMALNNAKDYLTFQAAFVFSFNGTKYAFVITDREKAKDFLLAYPFADNTTNEGRIFNKNYAVGSDFNTIYNYYMQGSLPSYSGSSQNDGMESAFAQILEKYNTGISIAKTDANGNLKPLRSVSFQYEIPASGGKKITGYRAEPCP